MSTSQDLRKLKNEANTIHINVISNNINMDKSTEHKQPNTESHPPYKILPFCLKLNTNNSNTPKSLSSTLTALTRLLNNLQPSQQEQVIQQRLNEQINKINSDSVQTPKITTALLSQLNRKQILQILYDTTALTHKINEILAVFKHKNKSESVSPPPMIAKQAKSINESLPLPENTDWRSRYMALQSKYDTLRSELKVSQWKWFDVYHWILSLQNSHFMQFERDLCDNLKIHNIDGFSLQILIDTDWQRLGITDLESCKLLMKEIEKFSDVSYTNVPNQASPETKASKNEGHPHSKLSETELAKLRIIDKKTAFIVGLPSNLCEITCLRSMFSRFGKIATKDGITIGHTVESIAADSRFIFIRFDSEQSVVQLIDYVTNHMRLEDGRICKATFGFTFYCMKKTIYGQCRDKKCSLVHRWCSPNEIMTDEMINRFRRLPSGAKTKGFGHTSPMHMQQSQILCQQSLQINSLQQSLQMIRAAAVDEVATLKKQLSVKTQEYDSLANSFRELRGEAESLQLKCCVLDAQKDEYKRQLMENECKMEIRNAEECVMESNDNGCEYMQWSFDEVYQWIVSLNNGHFEKYKMVYDNLKMEEIDGKCLEQLDRADIHRIGIKGFKDKVLLREHIQKLISNAKV